MTYLKTAILTLFCLLILMTGYFVVTSGEKHLLTSGRESYLRGDRSKALATLQKITSPDLQSDVFLLRSYIDRDEGFIRKSEEDLAESLHTLSEKSRKTDFYAEILLGKTLNAYLLHDYETGKRILSELGNVSQSPWISYFADRFSGAPATGVPTSYFSGPMQRSFEAIFSPFLEKAEKIRGLIREGRNTEARQTIEEELQLENAKNYETLMLLTGLSYMQEASTKSCEEAIPYHKLASDYYNRILFHDKKYTVDRENFLKAIKGQIEKLFAHALYDDLYFYVRIAEQWEGEEKNLDVLFTTFLDTCKGNDYGKIKNSIILLNRILPEGKVRNAVRQKIDRFLEVAIETGNKAKIRESLFCDLVFSGNFRKSDEKAAAIVDRFTIKEIQSPNPRFSHLNTVLEIRSSLDVPESSGFVTDLLIKTGKKTLQSNRTGEALSFFAYALQIGKHQADKSIREFLHTEFEAAFQVYSTEKLQSLRSIARALHYEESLFFPEEKETALIKEAQYLLANGKAEKAAKPAECVLIFSPGNPDAATIMGLIHYQKENYHEARRLLQLCAHPAGKVQEALLISKILSESGDPGDLHDLRGVGINLKLGLAELRLDRPESALERLKKIAAINQEAQVGLILAQCHLQQWDEALTGIEGLYFPFSKLPIIESAKIEGLIQLGAFPDAEHLLDVFFERSADAIDGDFSDTFRSFIKQPEIGKMSCKKILKEKLRQKRGY